MVRQRGAPLAVKRLLDVVGATLVLVPALPLLAALGVLVRLSSPGPALFRQTRLGKHRRPFTCYKLRTMTHGSSEEPHRAYVAELCSGETEESGEAGDARRHDGLFKLTDDPRITRVGGFLRASSLDELPQLLNVLRGEMSLVGPRPVVPYEVAHYRSEDLERFEVVPGITGLWQVSGRSQRSYRDMLALDVQYARRWSLWLDLKILTATFGTLVRGRSRAR